MEFLKKVIKFDLFGQGITLTINNEITLSTIYSQIMTKLAMIALCVYFAFLLNSMVQRTNLTTNDVISKAYPRPTIPLTPENFKFSFILINGTSDLVNYPLHNYRYFIPHITLYKFDGIKVSSTSYNFSRCKIDYFDDPLYYYTNSLEVFDCLDNFTADINGYFDENITTHFKFDITKCVNTTNSSNCAPKEKIDQLADRLKIGILMRDYQVDFYNYEKPFVPSIKYHSDMIHNGSSTYWEYYFQQVQVESQASFFDNSMFRKDSGFQITTDHRNYFWTDDTTVYQFLIFPYDKKRVITRAYEDIWTVFATIGGFAKLITMVCFILLQRINFLYFKSKITKKKKYRKNGKKDSIFSITRSGLSLVASRKETKKSLFYELPVTEPKKETLILVNPEKTDPETHETAGIRSLSPPNRPTLGISDNGDNVSEGIIVSSTKEKNVEEPPTNDEMKEENRNSLPEHKVEESSQLQKRDVTFNFRPPSITEFDEKFIFQRINEIVDNKFDHEDFKSWEFLLPFFSKNKTRFKEVEQEFVMMNDISVIARTVKEMQILKKLLLESYQINIFDFLVDNWNIEKENPDYVALIRSIRTMDHNDADKKGGEANINEKLATLLKKL